MKTKALILAAGYGTRLKPYTNFWPKCLMPINGIPLLEIWLDTLIYDGIDEILINTHHHSEEVISFLNKPKYKEKINYSYEKKLLGSAGTIRNNFNFIENSTLLLIHGDNLCMADLKEFHMAHINRPKNCCITMMTFETKDPQSCGIVETDESNILINFHEKVENPPGNKANAAIYFIEQEAIDFIESDRKIIDFSNDVIPNFLSKIYTWHNSNLHIDIGSINALREAQLSKQTSDKIKYQNDEWDKTFKSNIIHEKLSLIFK
jgi:mannose-1-phosphate guanylyltransferase